MKQILTILFALLFTTSVVGATYTPGKQYEETGVVVLTLTLAGKIIEYVYKPTLGSCLKSKRLATREIGGERVIFSCKLYKVLLEEDNQAKYGLRVIRIIE